MSISALPIEDESAMMARLYGPVQWERMMQEAKPTMRKPMSTEVATLESLDMAEVQKDVARFDAMLEQMKADYLPVLDIPITDKKQLEASKAARMNFKNTRLEGVARLDAGCKALYANWKLWVKARDTFEKKFSDVEELFRSNEKAFEEAEERRFLEIAQAEQRRVAARKERMFQIGFKFDGSKYILEGFAELTENEVSGLGVDDLQLGEWLNDLERQVAEHKERQEEEERTRRIAAEAMAAEQKRKDEEAAAKLAEIELREKEMQAREAAMNTKVNEARKNELLAMGCEVGDLYVGVRAADGKFMDILQDVTRLYVRSDAEWESDKAQYAEKIKQRDEEARVRREQQLQREAAERAVAEERERVEAEHRRQEEEKERAAYKEAERIASMGDKGLVEQLSAYLVCAPVPDLHTAVGQHGMARVRKHLIDLTNMVNSIAKDL
jgi:hypothetical protein